MPTRAAIALLTRYPVPGTAKTRLVPALGAEGAAALQREMSEHVAHQLRLLARTDGVHVEARVAGCSVRAARRWLGLRAHEQSDGDLGERQASALSELLRRAEVAAVIGGDCPTVTVSMLRRLLRAAEERGVAIIAARDGGYCALAVHARALAAARDALSAGIEWGGDRVLAQLSARLVALGMTPVVVDTCTDIDRPADLPEWQRVRAAYREPPSSVAVVVPVLSDVAHLERLLAALADATVEVIVADGGSTDGSLECAQAAGARVVSSAPGRARQMNAGAAAATADTLLFMHADTLPPEGFRELVLQALADPALTLGAFRFALDERTAPLRMIELGTRVRGAVASLPYGDQGLFCRRVAFDDLGGFPELACMEDYEFVRRARRAGRVRVLPEAAVTSARRWSEQGALRWTALNLLTVVRYRCGVPAAALAEQRARYSKR